MTHLPLTTHLHQLCLWLLPLPFALFTPDILQGQDGSTSTPRSSLSVELDPAPFLLKGYSLSVRYAPAKLPHWSVMASSFAANFPDGMMPATNRDAGWSDLRFKCSQALFVDYTVRKDGRGFFFGPSVFLYNNQVEHEASGAIASFRSIYPNVRVGYTWFPFRRAGFYLSPWVNVGSGSVLGTRGPSDGPRYEVAGFKYVAALHIGYRLAFH